MRSVLRSAVLALVVAGVVGLPPASSLPTDGDLRTPCDAMDAAHCLLPFPNDRFTTADGSTDTGKRIDLKIAEMPRSVAGKPIDPTEWNRNDGFSPGSMVLTFVPGLDLHATWGTSHLSNGEPVDPADHISDIGRYAAPDAPILLVDADTGERHPFWSELDTNQFTQPDERMLILRPAVNLAEGHRYLVALRNMRDADGNVIQPGRLFRAYRDGRGSDAGRGAHIRSVVDDIEDAEAGRGNAFDRSQLYLAWDFTVASARNLSERVLHIRDESFAELGDTDLSDGVIQGDPPAYTITEVEERTDGARQRQIRGTFTVPNYLDRPPMPPVDSLANPVQNLPGQSIPGGRFLYGLDGLPMRNPVIPTLEALFVCTIPAAASAGTPAHPLQYGHGLLGSRNEAAGGSTDRMREHNFMPCATDWIGMADEDIANAVTILADPSNMPSLVDRSQQGFLAQMFMGRLMSHPQGLAADAAFQTPQGDPLVETGKLVYDGNSQGAIMGAALAALSPDFTRATLGVPGMNYSTLLNRSVDWEGPLVPQQVGRLPSYSSLLYTMFPDKREQQVVIALIQMLWDRAEGNGYAAHMSDDPLPNTPAHQVMLHVAYGDFQVANVSAEVEARTIGARVMDTSLTVLPDRHWEVSPYFGLEGFPRDGQGNILPWTGSALVYWDSGNLAPPNGNVPPALDGGDPHEDPRRDPLSGVQRNHFFRTGEIVDVFGGGPYLLCRPGQDDNIPRVPDLFDFRWCPRP